MRKVIVAAIAAVVAVGLAGASAAAEENGGYVVVGAGSHDFLQRDGDHAAEFRLEYRDGPFFWHIRPFAGLSVTSSGTV